MCNCAIVFSAFALKESTDPSTVFLTFVAKIRQHGWKERVKISDVAKFETDLLNSNEHISPQSREILQTFSRWGACSCPPPPSPH